MRHQAAPAVGALSLAAAATGAVAIDVATAMASQAAVEYMSAVLGLRGTISNEIQESSFKDFADKHTTLNYPKQLIRERFAMSPLLSRLKTMTLANGIVYIAYVPPGQGKTTPCKAFLSTAITGTIRRRGIAFCPSRALRRMPSRW
jgi:hypothetical protein